MRPWRSTSASSPRRRAPSSMSSSDLSVSAFVVGVDLDRDAVLEAHAQTADDRAVAKRERLRRRDVAGRAQRVGRREDLLGRQVRQVAQPVGAREVGSPPAVRRQHADRELRPRPAQLDRVERARGQPLRRVAQHRHALVPRARGVAVVEPQHVLELVPEPLVRRVLVEVGIHERRPRAVRRRDDAPVRRAVADDLRQLLDAREHVAPDERLVEVVHAGSARSASRA